MRLWHFEFMRPNSCLPWLWGSCTILNVTQSGGFLWIGQHWQSFTSSRLPVPLRDSRPSFAPRVPAVRLEISMPREALMVLPMEAPVALPRDEDRTSSGDLQRHRQSKKHPGGKKKSWHPCYVVARRKNKRLAFFLCWLLLGDLNPFVYRRSLADVTHIHLDVCRPASRGFFLVPPFKDTPICSLGACAQPGWYSQQPRFS